MSRSGSGTPAPWLVERPIAHRGLHDRAHGRIENSLSAARAAIDGSYAIECDVQRSADGEAVVFHDENLARLTGHPGTLAELDRHQIRDLVLEGSGGGIPSLPDLFGLVAGAVPIVCEVKSRFDGDVRLADRVFDLAASYSGPLAIKSFDPAIIAHLRRRDIARPLGIVTEAQFDSPEWAALPAQSRLMMANMLHIAETRPDFLSFRVDDLPACGAQPVRCRFRNAHHGVDRSDLGAATKGGTLGRSDNFRGLHPLTERAAARAMVAMVQQRNLLRIRRARAGYP